MLGSSSIEGVAVLESFRLEVLSCLEPLAPPYWLCRVASIPHICMLSAEQ